MATFTAIIHTFNEEHQIARCLESVTWVDDILLVDTHSTDRTVEIARRYTDHIVFHEYRNSAETKNWAIPHAQSDWLVFLDADEVILPPLAQEIQQRAGNEPFTGYQVNREMVFWNRPLQSTYFNPNYQMRVFRKDSGCFEDKEVHAQVLLTGQADRMAEKMLHYSYRNLAAYVVKLNRFTTFEARQMQKDGIEYGPVEFPYKTLLRSLMAFIRLFFKHQGYRDRQAGFVLALLSALYVFLKAAKFWEFSRVQGDLGSDEHRQ